MKRFLLAALVAQIFYVVSAQVQTLAKTSYLWPVEGAMAGNDILYAPQSYMDGELNFGALYITALEGTVGDGGRQAGRCSGCGTACVDPSCR